MRRLRRHKPQEAELDITAFMNLMIVLVPVLLLGLVFSQITVLDLQLPESSGESSDPKVVKRLELEVRQHALIVNYPQGVVLRKIPALESGEHDYATLRTLLQQVKRQLREKDKEHRSITVLSEPDTSYQTLVTTMDTLRSYKAVVAASVVDAELFPNISFGDAPALSKGNTLAMGAMK